MITIKNIFTYSYCIRFILSVPFIFSIILNVAYAQSADANNILVSLKPSHPRLFAYDSRITAIKSQSDSISKQLLFILKNDAEKYLRVPTLEYPNGISNMSTSRGVQGRLLSLVIAYRIFDDKRYADKAKQELLQLASIQNWGTAHFLDVGEAALAAGVAYDWLYDELTPVERKILSDAIKNKALVPGMESKESADSWVNGNFNWNPVCNGGLAVAALAIADVEPVISKQIIDRAIKNIPTAGEAYSPHGSFAEGPSYWSYGTSFYVIAVEALRTALGSSFSLEKVPGFLNTADYIIQMTAPTGEEYNYSDYHADRINEPVMLWFANELKRPDLVQDELKVINSLHQKLTDANNAKGERYSRHTPLELLWWNPALMNQTKAVKRVLQWTASGDMPISVMRTSWDDPNAAFVAIKGGTPDNSHGHMDVGSFILEADGVRWALDLGTESYNKMREAKLDLWNYTQNSNRWTTFRAGPEGHNILRFNGERQLIAGKAEIQQLPSKNGTMGAEANLTSLYSNKAKNVTRKVVINADRTVSIQDEWTAKDSAVNVSFQWLTKATVTKTNDGLLLQQSGKSLQLKIQDPTEDIAIDVQDVSKSKAVQDSDNPGLSRIVITTKTKAGSNGRLHLNAYPGSVIKNKKQ